VYADETDARRALQALIAPEGDPEDPRLRPFVLAIEHRGDGLLIGHVGLSPFRGDVEVGFAVAEAFQRRGFATEAVVAACAWALERFELPSIVALAAEANQASRRVLARAGFESLETRLMDFQGTEQAVSVCRFHQPRPPRG
jgi:RimJ/RimL family protein N-acetyltransferase